MIVRDEAAYLLEWLAYHLCLGFDHLVVYDNESRDATPDILTQIASRDPRIDRVDWPDVPGCSSQLSAYQDALHQMSADWVAFLDIDEFLVLKEDATVHTFLERFPPEVSAVSINWMHFASSRHETYEEGLVIDRFTYRPPTDFARNEVVKSIVRPRSVEAMTAHVPYLREGSHCRADGSAYPHRGRNRVAPVIHHPAQVNHYVIKSKEEYENKRRRGETSLAPDDPGRFGKFGPEHWATYDINAELDDSLRHMLPDVREAIRRLTGGCTSSARHPETADPDGGLRVRVVKGQLRFTEARLRFQLEEQRERTLAERRAKRAEAGRAAELERRLADLQGTVASLHEEQARLHQELQHRSHEAKELHRRTSAAERQLQDIQNSTSWRLTYPLRWSIDQVRHRRRALARVLRPRISVLRRAARLRLMSRREAP